MLTPQGEPVVFPAVQPTGGGGERRGQLPAWRWAGKMPAAPSPLTADWMGGLPVCASTPLHQSAVRGEAAW